MARPNLSRRWLHPQTVPRGFLRLYMLTLLSRGPQSGYSIMQSIDERTEGAWRPGPGTTYPLLKSLAAEGLAKTGGSDRRLRSKTYIITAKGKRELEDTRRALAGMGRREPVMARLFFDLLPAAMFVSLMLRRYREGAESFRAKISELPKVERDSVLKEMRLLMEEQLQWIDGKLSGKSDVRPSEASENRKT